MCVQLAPTSSGTLLLQVKMEAEEGKRLALTSKVQAMKEQNEWRSRRGVHHGGLGCSNTLHKVKKRHNKAVELLKRPSQVNQQKQVKSNYPFGTDGTDSKFNQIIKAFQSIQEGPRHGSE